MSSLKQGKLPHQLGIVGADEAVGDEEIPKQVFVFKPQDCWEYISESLQNPSSTNRILFISPLLAKFLPPQSSGGSLRCN